MKNGFFNCIFSQHQLVVKMAATTTNLDTYRNGGHQPYVPPIVKTENEEARDRALERVNILLKEIEILNQQVSGKMEELVHLAHSMKELSDRTVFGYVGPSTGPGNIGAGSHGTSPP